MPSPEFNLPGVLAQSGAGKDPCVGRRILAFALLVGVLAVSACARGTIPAMQPAPDFDALRLSLGPVIACRSVPVTTADSAAVLLDLVEGPSEEKSRRVMVGYDSLGDPLYLTIMVQETTRFGVERTHAIAARFSPSMFGNRFVAQDANEGSGANPQQGGTAVRPTVETTDLSPAELQRAHSLASRIWQLPCRHGPSRGNES